MKKYFSLFLLFILSVNVYSQSVHKYFDEFGKKLTKKEFIELTKENKSYVFDNNVKVIRYKLHNGIMTDSTRIKIVNFLNKKSPKLILNTDIIIINAGIIEGNCNISNMKSYNDYLKKIKSLKNIKYFEILSKKSKKYKEQLVDDSLLVFNNFFKYYKWKINRIEKCGGTLIIYPNNKFIRIAGDGNSLEIFDVLKNKDLE